MSLIADLKSLEPSQRSAIWASYLGWTLDAFDYLPDGLHVLGDREGVRDRRQGRVAGRLPDPCRAADRRLRLRLAGRPFGRRPVLMVDIILFSLFEFASGFAPIADQPAGAALPVRDRDGRRMGARREPRSWNRSRRKLRGPVSGLLQSGYPSGYFVASLVYFLLFDTHRLARHVHGRRRAGAARPAHPHAREGKPGVRGAARQGSTSTRHGARAPLEDRALPRGADDRLQLLQPRHAGPLSDLPPEAAPLRHPHHRHPRPRS